MTGHLEASYAQRLTKAMFDHACTDLCTGVLVSEGACHAGFLSGRTGRLSIACGGLRAFGLRLWIEPQLGFFGSTRVGLECRIRCF